MSPRNSLRIARIEDDSLTETSHDRQVAALTTLLDVALHLSTEHDEDAILAAVTNGVCGAIPCERASLFLLDVDRKELFTRTVTELELQEIRIPSDRGIIGWVATERQATCVCDPAADDRWDSSIDRKTGFNTRNILAVPVLSPVDDRLLGVLQLINTHHDQFETFDTRVAKAFAAHAGSALERTRLQREAHQAAAWRREMELARRIQQSFLPEKLPDLAGYEFATWWQPAEFVSGDYYDWFALCDGRLGIVTGDVCGHGVGPSLVMASLRAMLRVLSQTTRDPQQILSLLADAMTDDLKETQFVTLILAAIDPVSHQLSFANAGHAPALHIRRQAGEIYRLKPSRLPLGFPGGPTLETPDAVLLAPGDLVLLGTDGIVEARNPQHELFGFNRLAELILQNLTASATELAERISRTVTEFQGGKPPTDDATLLIVSRLC